MFRNISIERADAIAIVTIGRPAVLNALDRTTLDELREAFLDLGADGAVRVAIVTGAGEKAFVAGADIRELTSLGPAAARAYAQLGQQVFDLIENLGKPVIAAINGVALGGGCELAMACTMRVAADSARLGQPEVHLGVLPGFAGTQRLPRLVGRGRALDLLLTGRQVTADEAMQIGLVSRVVPAAALMSEVRQLAAGLASQAPLAMQFIIEAVDRGLDMPFPAAQRMEAALFGVAASTMDMREGMAAFLEKRKPRFTGE